MLPLFDDILDGMTIAAVISVPRLAGVTSMLLNVSLWGLKRGGIAAHILQLHVCILAF